MIPKERIYKRDFIKIKRFSAKDNVERMRRQATDWGEIFAKDTSEKKTQPKYTQKNLVKLNHQPWPRGPGPGLRGAPIPELQLVGHCPVDQEVAISIPV